jgi:hypothetical protein
VQLEGLGILKKFINLIRSQTHDLLACNIFPQPLCYHVPPKQNVLETRTLFPSLGEGRKTPTLLCPLERDGKLAKQQVTVLSHLISHHAISLSPPPPHLREKLGGHQFQSAEEIVTAQGKKNRAFLQISAVFPAATPTLADLHSGQRRLFSGMMWICVNLCML